MLFFDMKSGSTSAWSQFRRRTVPFAGSKIGFSLVRGSDGRIERLGGRLDRRDGSHDREASFGRRTSPS